MSKNKSKLVKAIAAKEKEYDLLWSQLEEARKRRIIRCENCGKVHIIGKTELKIKLYYVSPYGCTEGDYYNESEWGFFCMKCKTQNRLLFNDDEKEDLFHDRYKYAFKSIERLTKEDLRRQFAELGITHWINNFSLDRKSWEVW